MLTSMETDNIPPNSSSAKDQKTDAWSEFNMDAEIHLNNAPKSITVRNNRVKLIKAQASTPSTQI